MRDRRSRFLPLVFLLFTRCDGCCDRTPTNPDSGPAKRDSAAETDGGCTSDGTSCAPPRNDAVCDQIASQYCMPLLTRQYGMAPSTCDLYSCASKVNDDLNPHPDAAPLSSIDRSRAAIYLTQCVSLDMDGGVPSLLQCPRTAVAMLVNAPEKGPIAPPGALTIPGDLAGQVRCAYSACRQFAGACFGDDYDGGGFPATGAQIDSCLAYRLCLAGCRQNISDPLRRSQCVIEQCDPVFPNGHAQFLSYRTCMLGQQPACGHWGAFDAGTDAP
jgi:hypothetical protein